MDFNELIFDVYCLAEKIQKCANDLSGLEFADERGYLDDAEADRLRDTESTLGKARKLAEFRLETIRENHSASLAKHFEMVIAELSIYRKGLQKKNDDKLKFDLEILDDLLVHIGDVQRGKTPEYSVWWVFYSIASTLGRRDEYRFSGKNPGALVRPIAPRCPACSFPNDITGSIDLFLPPTGERFERVTILDEYTCAGCRQRFQVMFRIHFREPVEFELVDVGFPPVTFTW